LGGNFKRVRDGTVSLAAVAFIHQALVSSLESEPAVSSGAGARATTTMAGRNSRPFSVQAGVQA